MKITYAPIGNELIINKKIIDIKAVNGIPNDCMILFSINTFSSVILSFLPQIQA